MALSLFFAGIRVSDFEAAKDWYARLRKAIYRDADGNEISFGGVPK